MFIFEGESQTPVLVDVSFRPAGIVHPPTFSDRKMAMPA